jgi:hypothetical protein
MLEQIGIDREIKKEIVLEILSNEFNDYKIYYIDHAITGEKGNEDYFKNSSIGFSIIKIECEFPIKVEVYGLPDKNNEEREQYLAKVFSDKLSCKTITGYQDKKNPDYPYYSIVFFNGLTYLANDYDTVWADGEGGEVKVIEEIKLESYNFDKKGNLKMGSS